MKFILMFLLLFYLAYADIDNVEIFSENSLIQSEVNNHSDVRQSHFSVLESDLTNSEFNLQSSISEAEITQSYISQSALLLNDSLIGNSNIQSSSTISNDSGEMRIVNARLIQSKIHLVDGSINNSNINIDSSISSTTLENSILNQCSLYVGNRANLSHRNIHGSCSIKNSKIRGGVNLTQALMVFED